eukprot:scaffold868_cov249-Pinguiococcus_pyrenoidosus.AAC.2
MKLAKRRDDEGILRLGSLAQNAVASPDPSVSLPRGAALCIFTSKCSMKLLWLLSAVVTPASAWRVAAGRRSLASRALLTRTYVTYEDNKDYKEEAMDLPELKAVHPFGAGKGTRSEDGADLKWLLGGKGANLAEMAALGLPVPPGFTLTAAICNRYHQEGGSIPDDVWAESMDGLKHIEEALGARLGDKEAPLLLSVRSGAAVSMPGMMDTVLNLGLNDEVVEALAAKTGNPRFAYDS